MADLRSYIVGMTLADNLAAPGSDFQFVGSFGMMYDGANWDQVRGTSADGLLVNLGGNNDVTVTGTVTADTELPAAAALTDNFANPTAPAVGAFAMLWDGATWDRAPGTAAAGLLVDLGANNDVVVSATDLDIRDIDKATDDITVYANTAKDGSGTAYVPLVDTDGHLQVDVLSGAGTDTPTNPAAELVSSSGTAAGAEANLTTAELGGKKLWGVTVWASVPYKARVFLVNNSVEATHPLAVGGGQAGQAWSWTPPNRNFTTLGTTAGLDAWRVEFTNLDMENAGDGHAAFAYADN